MVRLIALGQLGYRGFRFTPAQPDYPAASMRDFVSGAYICDDASGNHYRCGQVAALALSDKIGTATVACDQRDTDRYRRVVAICRMGDIDLGARMVSEGLAVEYRRCSNGRYRADETAAKAARRGLWAGRFEWPREWRRSR